MKNIYCSLSASTISFEVVSISSEVRNVLGDGSLGTCETSRNFGEPLLTRKCNHCFSVLV